MAKYFHPKQSFMVPVPSCPAFSPMARAVLTQVTRVQPVPPPRVGEDASEPLIKAASRGL